MNEIKAPDAYDPSNIPTVFLAGSIEMGKACDWQTVLKNKLTGVYVQLLNPRRDDWDNSWEQSIENEKFCEQVEWELGGIEDADLVIFYFDKQTQSPITLLELGIAAASKSNVVVCCPDGFWRKGNVDIVCHRYEITVLDTLDELAEYVIEFCSPDMEH